MLVSRRVSSCNYWLIFLRVTLFGKLHNISNKEGTRALESMIFRWSSRSNMWSFLGGYEFEPEWDSLIITWCRIFRMFFCYGEVMWKFQKSPKSKDSRDWSWTWAVKKASRSACSGCFQGWSTAMEHWVAPQIPSKWFPSDLNVLVFGLIFCCESLPQENLPNNQATQRPPNQSSHEELPKCSLTAAFEDRDWQMMKGDPPLGWGFCWDLVQILMNPVIGCIPKNGCEIVFKLNVELDVPTLKQISLSLFLEENSCCFWVAPIVPCMSRVRGK